MFKINHSVILSFLCLMILLLASCNKNSKGGIIEQAIYVGEKKNIINTFYIYDFVDSSVIREHSLGSLHYPDSETYNYYFSHNSNIPNQELMNAKSFLEAKKTIREYSFSIKYASKKEADGRVRVVNCFEFPNDTICNKE